MPAQGPSAPARSTQAKRIRAMQKPANSITLKGDPLALLGPQLKAGDRAPDFTCATGMKETVRLAQTPAKARLFSVVPSLDTPVCSTQTKKFSDQLAALGDQITSYTVSMDLPFAQKRFCGDKAIANMQNLSDTHDQSFGKNYGVLIDGLALPLLARAVFVVDRNGTISYAEYVPEIVAEPNYDAALKALKAAV
jgi:thiol peroxidase